MAGLTRSELAGRAGCDEARVERLVEAGYLVPEDGRFAEGDVQRIRLAEAFERAGIAVEDIVRGMAAGALDYSNLDPILAVAAPFTTTTYVELAAAHGRDLEFVRRLVGALALPRPEADARLRADDAEVLPFLLERWESFTDEETLRFARAYGDGIRRISEAATALFHSAVTLRVVELPLPVEERSRRVGEEAVRLTAVAERLVEWLHRRHIESRIFELSVEGTEEGLAAAGVRPARPERSPAIAFLDLTGYTALTETQGDEAAADLAVRLGAVVEEAAADHGGRPVKWLGDGVMFHFPEPPRAVAAALDLVERTPGLGLPPSRVGVSAGPVVHRDGDYYGRTVNLAARVADYARPGEVLVTELVREAVADGEFDPLHPVALKGVSDPVRLYRARR